MTSNEMSSCPSCGAEMPITAAYCPFCGQGAPNFARDVASGSEAPISSAAWPTTPDQSFGNAPAGVVPYSDPYASPQGGPYGPYAPNTVGPYYGASPYAQYGYGYGYQVPQQEKGATTALVLGIVCFFFCGILLGPAAIIEGVKARKRIAQSNGQLTGDGMALAGIILGSVYVVLFVVVVTIWVVMANQPPSAPTRLR